MNFVYFYLHKDFQKKKETDVKHRYAIEQDQDFRKIVPIDRHYKTAFDSLDRMVVEVAVVTKVDLENVVSVH